MGGGTKGHLHSNGSRGRSYGLMLLLAFGIAIFGVMVIHKLRERHIFNLLVKEKDHQLISLQLLLQKEREYGKEAKWKIEEMKAKMHSLRLQKAKLDNRILQMQWTISSLRDEEKMIELAFEEKQNEIRQLKERFIQTNDEHNQSKALSEILRQKEAEIEELKHRLELPVTVWSVSTDDPANPAMNSIEKASRLSGDETKVNEFKEEGGKLHESITGKLRNNTTQDAEISKNQSAKYRRKQSATQGDDTRENGLKLTDDRSKLSREEESQKLEGSQNGGFEHGSSNQNRDKEDREMNIQGSQDEKLFGTGKRKNNGYARIHEYGSEVQKRGDEEQYARGSGNKEAETRGISLPVKLQNSEDGDNQELLNNKSGTKLEMPENFHGGGYTFRGKHGDIKKIRGKRWRTTAKRRENNGNSKTDGLDENPESVDKDHQLSMDLRRNRSAPIDLNATVHDKLPQDEGLVSKIDQPIGLRHHKHEARVGDNRADTNRRKGGDSPPGATFLMHGKLEDAEDMRREVGKTGLNPQVMKGLHSAVKQAAPDTTTNSVNNRRPKEARQKPDEAERSEKQVIIQPNEQSMNGNNSRQAELGKKDKDPEDLQMEDAQDTDTATDTSRQSTSISEDNGEEYKEQNNEPEF